MNMFHKIIYVVLNSLICVIVIKNPFNNMLTNFMCNSDGVTCNSW